MTLSTALPIHDDSLERKGPRDRIEQDCLARPRNQEIESTFSRIPWRWQLAPNRVKREEVSDSEVVQALLNLTLAPTAFLRGGLQVGAQR